ncbi:MAG: thiamine phosphate synthase [Mariprofundales bacterium]|nr:thiamine phosphate synthase [Mariprofundales bacterium]
MKRDNTAPQLLYITDSSRTGQERLLEVVRIGLQHGVDGVLLREPTLNSGKLLALASTLRELTRQHHAQLIIHSQADIARAVSADGVHLSSTAIDEAPAMRRWLAPLALTISASCHQAAELKQAALAGIDYALLSPLFTTASHPKATALGANRFTALATQSPIPVLALGGINPDNRNQVPSSAHGVAVMRGLDEAAHITDAADLLLG